jgi:hypothetical protein
VVVVRSNYATKEILSVVANDVAHIREHCATKQELSIVAQDVAVIRANYVTKEELHKLLHAQTWKMYGFGSLIAAVVFSIDKYLR